MKSHFQHKIVEKMKTMTLNSRFFKNVKRAVDVMHNIVGVASHKKPAEHRVRMGCHDHQIRFFPFHQIQNFIIRRSVLMADFPVRLQIKRSQEGIESGNLFGFIKFICMIIMQICLK